MAALDIESKLSEAALAVCQVVDFRQFAHGRHLQLATENPPALVLVLHSQHDAPLAQRTINLVPSGIKRAVFAFPDDLAEASIEGFIFATLLTELVAEGQGVDPGRPEVPKFCRELHSIDVRAALPPIQKSPIPAVDRKLSAARTDLSKHREWTTEAIRFCEALCAARFKAIVCDFDGTFCETDRRFEGLDERLIPSIVRLLRAKITIGFATGRGDSLYGDLSRKLPPDVHQGIFIGYYTGSTVVNLNERPEFGPNDVNLDRLSNWIHSVGIAHRLRASPAVKVSQLGIRVEDQRFKASAIEAIRSQLQESVGASCRVFSSGHSIDVISGPAGKERVVEKISQAIGCDPLTDMLRIGDSGDHDGNDFELLNVGFGLSVGSVSCLPDRCWNFLPSELSGVPGTRHYFDSLDVNDGYVRFCDRFLSETISALRVLLPPLE